MMVRTLFSLAMAGALLAGCGTPTPATPADRFSLAMKYQLGKDVPRNEAEAARLYALAAQDGDVRAMNNLANMYSEGLGVARNEAEAVRLYAMAASGGNLVAKINLARRYEAGIGVARDEAAALRLYREAADAGSANGSVNHARLLAAMRHNGARPSGGTAAPVEVALTPRGGAFTVPVRLNDAITMDFLLDTGASDVVIPADVFLTLTRTGTITPADMIGQRSYRLADGRTVTAATFRLRSLRIGGVAVEDVVGSVAPVSGTPLLGQGALTRFRS